MAFKTRLVTGRDTISLHLTKQAGYWEASGSKINIALGNLTEDHMVWSTQKNRILCLEQMERFSNPKGAILFHETLWQSKQRGCDQRHPPGRHQNLEMTILFFETIALLKSSLFCALHIRLLFPELYEPCSYVEATAFPWPTRAIQNFRW